MPSEWPEDRYGGYGREQSQQNSDVRGSRSQSYYDKYKVTESTSGGGRSRGDSRRRSRDRGRRDRSRSRDRSRGRRRKSRSSSRSRSREKAKKKRSSGWDEPPQPAEIILPPGHSTGATVDPGLAAIVPGQGINGISVAPPPDAPPAPPPPYSVPKGGTSSISAALEAQAKMLAAKAEAAPPSNNPLIAETIADAKAKAAVMTATTPKSAGTDAPAVATPAWKTVPTPEFRAVSSRVPPGPPGAARPAVPVHSIYQRSSTAATNNSVLPTTPKPMPSMPQANDGVRPPFGVRPPVGVRPPIGVRPPVAAMVSPKAPVAAPVGPAATFSVVSKASAVQAPAESFAPTNSGSAPVESPPPVHFGEFVSMKEVSPALAALMSGSL